MKTVWHEGDYYITKSPLKCRDRIKRHAIGRISLRQTLSEDLTDLTDETEILFSDYMLEGKVFKLRQVRKLTTLDRILLEL